jgi:hypothetical protein
MTSGVTRRRGMLYTTTPSPPQGEGLCLYFCPDEARDAAGVGLKVFGVSVHYDPLMKRLVPIGSLYRGIDPAWTMDADWQEGRILARGPIPTSLFFPWDAAEHRGDGR